MNNTLYNDLTICTSEVFRKLQFLQKESEILKDKAQRIDDLNKKLTYLIQTQKITNIETIDCAISWLYNSNLDTTEIINKIIEKDS